MKAETARTHWSKDPEEAPPNSDWRITFVHDNDNDDTNETKNDGNGGDDDNSNEKCGTSRPTMVVTYHVHRCMIGPPSEYFTRLFYQPLSSNDAGGDDDHQRVSFSESRNQQSRIEFSKMLTRNSFDSIIKAFETFLDYCYLDSKYIKPERFDDDNLSPVALYFLSDYFQIQHNDFMSHIAMYTEKKKKFLCSLDYNTSLQSQQDKVDAYYCLLCKDIINFRSESLNVETIQRIFVECCSKDRKCLSPESPLSKIIDVTLWLAIALNMIHEGYPFIHSHDWSNNIAYFIDNNDAESVDDDAFLILSNSELIPRIHPNAAVILLEKEQSRGLHKRAVENDNATKTTTEEEEGSGLIDKVDDDTMLSDLQERSVESFDSAQLELEDNDVLREKVLNVMSPAVMKAYLRQTLVSMRKVINEKDDEIRKTKREKKEAVDQITTESNNRQNLLNRIIGEQIIDIIARNQEESPKCSLEECISTLPNIPRSDIDQVVLHLIGTNQIICCRDRDINIQNVYTINQVAIEERALSILRNFKRQKMESNLATSDLTKMECDVALSCITTTSYTRSSQHFLNKFLNKGQLTIVPNSYAPALFTIR